MLCTSLAVVGEPSKEFTLKADKASDTKPFTAKCIVSYPTKPGETVSIVQVKTLALDTCIQNIKLDAAGQASFDYQVNETHEIYMMHGLGCCAFAGPQCTQSNRLKFTVGAILMTMLPWLVLGIGAMYVLGSVLKGRRD